MYSWKNWGLALAVALALVARAGAGDYMRGGCGSCEPGCQMTHCPPHLKHCWEGPPRFCWRQGCPRPAINICTQPQPFWGYYQTCWTPWPWGPDWSHCPMQPPASLVFPPGPFDGNVPTFPQRPPQRPILGEPSNVVPSPRPVEPLP